MYKYCSPSRGSFLTGRYPWKLASTRCNFIPSTTPEGVDLGYQFLPLHLKQAGYASHHIGKWHLVRMWSYRRTYTYHCHCHCHCHCHHDYHCHRNRHLNFHHHRHQNHLPPLCTVYRVPFLPFSLPLPLPPPQGFHETNYTAVARGFDTSWGFLEGGEDHWSHECSASKATCHVPGRPKKTNSYWDLWTQSTSDFPGRPLYGLNGTKGDLATYSGYVFTQRAVDTIKEHSRTYLSAPRDEATTKDERGGTASSSIGGSRTGKPLFMYLALHNTHAPIEAPARFVSMYDTGDVKKDTFLAMVSVVDETVKNVTDALKAEGMWDNTLLVWSTDNGSPVQVAGSNHPLRGGKSTNWEGGVRVPTFVSGGALPVAMRGTSLDGLVHVSDW